MSRRQVIIDDAVNNYGLVYGEKTVKDESSWFPPVVIWKGVNPDAVYTNVTGL